MKTECSRCRKKYYEKDLSYDYYDNPICDKCLIELEEEGEIYEIE